MLTSRPWRTVTGFILISYAWLPIAICPHAEAQSSGVQQVKFVNLKEATAPEYAVYSTARFILHIDKHRSNSGDIRGPEDLASHSLSVLNRTYDDLQEIFASAPTKKVVLKFLSPAEFRRQTGAPAWTSAMFYRDEITVPMAEDHAIDYEELGRALRHEYVHAYVAEVSKYRCPAWLDEGVAQLIEGDANPLLGPALRKWVARNPAIPLDWLHNGFTTLDSAIVPAAYAQSLFATRVLVEKHGYSAIQAYLKGLGSGLEEPVAFEKAFDMPKAKFENDLTATMRQWAKSDLDHP